ncbi:MAG: Ribulose-phosphate 3-epimerase, partial [uncultured Sphingomonas sp.]
APDRPLHPVRRLRQPRRGGPGDRRRRSRLDPCGRDGRPLRPQPDDRPGGREGAPPPFGQAVRRPPDDLPGRPVPRRVRRGGGRHHHRSSGSRATPSPHDPADQGAGQEGGRVAQPGDARQDARLRPRRDRPRPRDERQSRFRRAELHREPAQEDRGDCQAGRQGGSRGGAGGRRRGRSRYRPAVRGCGRNGARRRHGGVSRRSAGLCRQHRRAAGSAV